MRDESPQIQGDSQKLRASTAGTTLGDFDCRRYGDEWEFTWLQHQITVRVSRVREMAMGVHAEMGIYNSSNGPIDWGGINLVSTTQRETRVKQLLKTHPRLDWRGILDRTCRKVVEQHRAGEPVVELQPHTAAARRFLVDKIVPAGQISGVFAPGGDGKSLFGLALALAVSTGTALPCGIKATQRANVLLTDWEADQQDHETRLEALARGLEIKRPSGIFYRRMHRPLVDDAARVRSEIARRQIGLVIVDSYGPAAGLGPEGADACIPFMSALGSFAPASSLVFTHVSKAGAEQRTGAATPYGSVYFINLCRTIWELRRSEDQDSDALVIGLFHRKANQTKLFPPMGLRFEFGGDGAIRIKAHDITERTDLLARTSLGYRLQELLRSGARTTDELAEGADSALETVSRTLRRLHRRGKVVPLEIGGKGRGDKQQWGLVHMAEKADSQKADSRT